MRIVVDTNIVFSAIIEWKPGGCLRCFPRKWWYGVDKFWNYDDNVYFCFKI